MLPVPKTQKQNPGNWSLREPSQPEPSAKKIHERQPSRTCGERQLAPRAPTRMWRTEQLRETPIHVGSTSASASCRDLLWNDAGESTSGSGGTSNAGSAWGHRLEQMLGPLHRKPVLQLLGTNFLQRLKNH
jgi:hypothetical protein